MQAGTHATEARVVALDATVESSQLAPESRQTLDDSDKSSDYKIELGEVARGAFARAVAAIEAGDLTALQHSTRRV